MTGLHPRDRSAGPARDLTDTTARQRITAELDRTLFVEAGAGSGKTKILVDRVVETVLAGGVPLRHIAAVTFTDKAAAELRDRLRIAFEHSATVRADDCVRVAAAETALDDLDGAAIGTLHSFAQRILSQHPIEAGLPPLIEVSDEVASQVRFEELWAGIRADLLDDPDAGRLVLLGLAAGLTLDHLRSIALIFNGEWDRLESSVIATSLPAFPRIEIDPLLAKAKELCALEGNCTDDEDGFLVHLADLEAWAGRLERAVDAPAQLELLGEGAKLKSNKGRQGNWPNGDLKEAKARLKALRDRCAELRQRTLDAVLRHLARRIAVATVVAARERQSEGRLEFHDLLVLTREVLRSPVHGPAVRDRLHQRYQRLLLDEFQDTDPIQVEIAVRIAAGATGGGESWQDVDVPEGRLFLVGDPKQSIYRFRRADIATYLDAQNRLGENLSLTTNFRTTAGVLEWINATFGQLIRAEPGSQPGYRPLDHYRDDAPGGTQIVALGAVAHPAGTLADDVRAAEAADVAAAVRTALAERWQVHDPRTRSWRDVGLCDIAVLVPARTSLPQLEQALDRAGIPYRAEASSLVYRTAEVRDLLMAARAVDDPSDALALVATLRSSLFGCGDDDLWTWKEAGGSFNLLSPIRREVLDTLPDGHPVGEGIAYLRGLHGKCSWLAPSKLLDRLVRDRRMLEVAGRVRAGVGPGTRDVWRRLRFVVDQARAWSESEHGGLRAYLAWASRQGEESARVAEVVLPETDVDAVRVMTVHAAKGLEFPVVIVSGLSSRPMTARNVEVLWGEENGYAVKAGSRLETGDFEAAKSRDEQMSHQERIRLLYVACTRARDHLVVSLHRVARRVTRAAAPVTSQAKTNAELLDEASRSGPVLRELTTTDAPTDLAPGTATPVVSIEPFDQWQARVRQARATAARRSAVSASSLEGARTGDPGLAEGLRDLELPLWNKGRYGAAIGRAVHGTLQTVDLLTGSGLEDAVAAQVFAEGVQPHRDVVTSLCRSALATATVRRAATRPYWRETYVGCPLDDLALAARLLTLDRDPAAPQPSHPAGPPELDPDAILEGYIDLLYRDDDGSLVIVDYKTDTVPAAAIPTRVAFYRPQMLAYARALTNAVGQSVSRGVLLFLHPQTAIEEELELT